jgi:hypothetical protein
MDRIAQEIPPVPVINVNAVSIEPRHWPRVNHGEPKAAVLKTSGPIGEFSPVHVKRVATPKAGSVAVVRNAPMTCRGLCPAGLSLFLSALRLLCRPCLLLLLLLWLLLLLVLSLRVGGSNGAGKQLICR